MIDGHELSERLREAGFRLEHEKITSEQLTELEAKVAEIEAMVKDILGER